jgi:polyisoprenoid-binding protein YceI
VFTRHTKIQTSMKRTILLLFVFAVIGSVSAQSTWTVDKSHSKIGFSVTHMVVSETEGQFKAFDITLTSPTEDFNGAAVEFTAQVESIDTENEKRDGHLKSEDFFNAAAYPQIKFKGNLEKVGSKYQLKGDLTIKATTKPVVFDVAYGGNVKAFGGERAGFKVTGAIKRFDYGLTWDKTIESGSLIVGDEVQIICKIELQKKPNP